MIGVSFQPGSNNSYGQSRPNGDNGVQEAIKVLSLRLPRVVGAQAVSPQALLSSPGGGGRADSVVNAILSKMFPTGQSQPPMQAQSFGMAPGMPSLSGMGENPLMARRPEMAPMPSAPPRVTVGLPPQQTPPMAPFTGGPGDRPSATPDGGFTPMPGLIAPLPKRSPFPDFPEYPSVPPREPEPLI